MFQPQFKDDMVVSKKKHRIWTIQKTGFFSMGFHTQNEGTISVGPIRNAQGQHMVKPKEEPGQGRLMPEGDTHGPQWPSMRTSLV